MSKTTKNGWKHLIKASEPIFRTQTQLKIKEHDQRFSNIYYILNYK